MLTTTASPENTSMLMHSQQQIILKAEHLSKQVQLAGCSLTILEDISFLLTAGCTMAIVGRSGSGKSTLLSLLAGLDLPNHGDVILSGVHLNSLDEDGRARLRREQIGFVFQSFQLLAALPALENVALPLELLGRNDAREQAIAILERVGLASRIHHYPHQLSGGEQQRVAIARAFVIKPQLLFADEPTGNLDTLTGDKISHLLFELNAESGTSLVLVTHDERLAKRCDGRLVLLGGQMVGQEGLLGCEDYLSSNTDTL